MEQNDLDLEHIMQDTSDQLFHFIFKIVLNKETAEEIFQETWLNICKNIDSFDITKPFKPWLYRIARNLSFNFIKKENLKKRKILDIFNLSNENQEKPVLLPEDEENITNILGKLPLKFRDLIHLRFFENLDVNSIAKILKLPNGTVKSRLHRGIKILRKTWEDYHET